MEVEVLIPLWQVIVLLIGFAGSFAVVAYMTRVNTTNIKTLATLTNEMMKEKVARSTFVTLELYKSEVNHLNRTLEDVKAQNTQILTILTSTQNKEK